MTAVTINNSARKIRPALLNVWTAAINGDARFASLDDADARPVANRAGFRKGVGAEREWWVLPEVWRAEICAGHDSQFVARVLAGVGMLRTQAEGLQCKVRVGKDTTLRAYVVTAAIFQGAADAP